MIDIYEVYQYIHLRYLQWYLLVGLNLNHTDEIFALAA